MVIGNLLMPYTTTPTSNLQEMLRPLGEHELRTEASSLLVTIGFLAMMIGVTGVYRSITVGGMAWARLGFYVLLVGTALQAVSLSLDVATASSVGKWLAAPVENKEAAWSVVVVLNAIGRGVIPITWIVYWLAFAFLGIGMSSSPALIFWAFRQTTFFLGDAMFVMRGLRTLRSAADIPPAIINAPLSGWFTWQIYQALLPKNPADAHQLAFQVFSVLLGVANLALLSRMVREIGADAQDRALAFLFLAGGGTAQMCFGYVENYTLALVAGLLFSWLAVLHFRGRAHAALPMAAFGVLFVSHFGFFVMLPVAVLLLGRLVLRKKYLDAALGVVDAEYGSVPNYLAAIGVTDEQLARLRTTLVG